MTEETGHGVNRRGFMTAGSTVAMASGLAASYGTFGVIAGRSLYPNGEKKEFQFLATVASLKLGDSMTYVAPSGAKIVVARQGEGDTAEDFIALSSVCPHLGCQVHWEPQNDRFFCPCHNGAFDSQGVAIEGPPEKAGQKLIEFPLMVKNGLLYIEVPMDSIKDDDQGSTE